MAAKKSIKGSLLIGIMADEATVTGFLLTGIGQKNNKGEKNFFIIDKESTLQQIENDLQSML